MDTEQGVTTMLSLFGVHRSVAGGASKHGWFTPLRWAGTAMIAMLREGAIKARVAQDRFSARPDGMSSQLLDAVQPRARRDIRSQGSFG